jgi:two-component system, NarL family, sensor histidine kinase UhpB
MSVDALDSSVAGWFSRQNLFFRLALLVAVPLALLAIAAVINARKEYDNVERTALEQASALARQAAARLDEHYDDLDQFLTAVAEVARETLQRGVDGDPALARMIHAMPQHVTGLSILSLNGSMLASTAAAPEARAKVNVSDRPYFKDSLASRRLVVGEPAYSRLTDLWVSISARPVQDDVGRAIGVVSTSSRMDRIHTILVPSGLPLGALMTVFNDRGVGVASTAEPRAAIGRDFSTSETVRRVLRERELSAKTLASDGHMRFVAYAGGEKLPWIVEVGLPVDLFMAPAKQQLHERLSLLAIALVLGLAAAALLARRIGDPLGKLAQDVDDFGKGRLAHRTKAAGYGEVNRLGAAFNRMADAVGTQGAALRASEERFRSLVMLSSDWYWTQDTEHRFTSHSQGRFGDTIAISASDFHGKARWEMPGAEPLGTSWDAHRAQLKERRAWRDLVVRYVDKDGETQYIASSGEPTFGANGEFTGYRGVARLETERFRLQAERATAEAAVRESDAKFRALTALSSDWYWEQDADFRFTSVGSDDPDWALPMIGKTRWELNGEPLGQTWADHKAQLEQHETFRDVVFRYTGAHGATAYLGVSGEPVFGEAGIFRGYRGTATSVTERVRLENGLRAANERLSRLSRQLLDAQESERRQIAHELHDEIGQSLSALKLFAGHVRARVPPSEHAAVDEWIGIVDGALAQVRDLSRILRPVQLDHMGLAPALRALLDTQARAAGWVATFEAKGEPPHPNTRVDTVCYRIVQEALNNAARHALAASVSIRLEQSANEVRVHIEDDGRGFDLAVARARMREGASMGLLGMEERVRLAGGSFHIETAPAHGTRIDAVMPVVVATEETP